MKFVWTIALLLCVAVYADETPLTSGVDRSAFDTSVSPGTDFFQYVNGGWNKANPIPPEYSDWGSFNKLRDDNLIALRGLVEDLNKPGEALDDNRRKLRDFYATATDDAKLDSQGDQPLREELAAIETIRSREELLNHIAHLHGIGVEALFSVDVDQDEKQSDRYAFQLWQGGMGMPERDYYVGTSEESKAMLSKW